MEIRTAGSTDVSVYVEIVQDAGGTNPGEPATGLTNTNIDSISYTRNASADVTDATVGSNTPTGAHSDGTFAEVDGTNSPGIYRVDVEDAAFASGSDFVVIKVNVAAASNAMARPLKVILTDFDLQTATPTVNATQISGDTTTADIIQQVFGGTSGTADSGSTTTLVDAARTEVDDFWNGAFVVFSSGSNSGLVRMVTDFVAATDTMTLYPALPNAVSTDAYVILRSAFAVVDVHRWLNTLVTAGVGGRPAVDAEGISGSTGAADSVEANIGNLNAAVADVETDTQDIQSRLPAALVAGRMNSDATAISGSGPAADNVEANIGNLNATVSSRATQTTADNIEADTQDIQSRLPAALVSGRMNSDIEAINDDSTAAVNARRGLGGVVIFTVQAAPAPTTTTCAGAAGELDATDDHYNGRHIVWVTGALAGQETDITDYAGTNRQFTFTAVTEAASAGDIGVVV